MNGQHVGPVEVRDGDVEAAGHLGPRDTASVPVRHQFPRLLLGTARVAQDHAQRSAQGVPDLVPQLVRGGVGEGDDEERPDLLAFLDHQARRQGRQGIGLAGSRARLDQRHPVAGERQVEGSSFAADAAHGRSSVCARTSGSRSSRASAAKSSPSGLSPSYARAA